MRNRQSESSFGHDWQRAETVFRQPLFAEAVAVTVPAPPKSPANRWLIWVIPPALVGATAIIAELAKEPQGKPNARLDHRSSAPSAGSLSEFLQGLGEIQGRKDPRLHPQVAASEAVPAPAPSSPAISVLPPSPARADGSQKGGIGDVQPLPKMSSTTNDSNETHLFPMDMGHGIARGPAGRRADQPAPAARDAERMPANFRAEIASLLQNRNQRSKKELAANIQAVLKAHETPQTTDMGNQLSEITSRSGHFSLERRVRVLRSSQIPDTLILKHIVKDELQHLNSRNGPQSMDEVWIQAASKLIKLQ